MMDLRTTWNDEERNFLSCGLEGNREQHSWKVAEPGDNEPACVQGRPPVLSLEVPPRRVQGNVPRKGPRRTGDNPSIGR